MNRLHFEVDLYKNLDYLLSAYLVLTDLILL